MNSKTVNGIKCFLYVLGLLVMALPAQAASFDCGKVATKVENLICGDAELSKLDDELSVAYTTALQDEKQADSMRQAQKQWMKERNGCLDVGCMKNAYLIRIHELVSTQGQAEVQSKTIPAPLDLAGHYKLIKGSGEEVCEAYRKNFESHHDAEPMACERNYDPKIKGFSSPQWKKLDFKKSFDLYIKTLIYRNSLPRSQGTSLSDEDMREYIKQLSAESPENLKKELYLAQLDMEGNGKLVNILAVRSYGCGPDSKTSAVNSKMTSLYVINKTLTDMDYSLQKNIDGWGFYATIELYKGMPYVEHYEPDDNWGHLLTGSGRLYVMKVEPLRRTEKKVPDEKVTDRLASVCEFQYVPPTEKTE